LNTFEEQHSDRVSTNDVKDDLSTHDQQANLMSWNAKIGKIASGSYKDGGDVRTRWEF
jgi:hypothetical protein